MEQNTYTTQKARDCMSPYQIRLRLLEIALEIVKDRAGSADPEMKITSPDVIAEAIKLNVFVSDSYGRDLHPIAVWLDGGVFRRIDAIEYDGHKGTRVICASEYLGSPRERHFRGEGKTVREAAERLAQV